MERNINVAEILKDKPKGTKLYDLLYNVDVELDKISTTDTETVVWCTNETDNNTTCHRGYSEFGTIEGFPDGLQILLPSKEMRDWSKFAWKKGDVLVSNDYGTEVIFYNWYDDTYTNFYGKHRLDSENKNNIKYNDAFLCTTGRYSIEDKDAAQTYINTIEERLGGKLNLETLEIEKKPEFKDGDIITITTKVGNILTFIFRAGDVEKYYCHAFLYGKIVIVNDDSFYKKDFYIARPSTEEEQKQLFDALAKKGKTWDAENKKVIDLKPKWTPKPFDRVVTRVDDDAIWTANIFSHMDSYGEYVTIGCVGGYYYCLPYNDETAKLIGTTNNWKG